ncbi:uncharacterized protein E2P81_ATG10778 [Venturia nashicola]|uniref:Uncharacterized protein n=1 Tax=Venturia nashicola TaxID=86259 RepID=A0A4Z1P6X2_9PEZI|nr:hypothetical protein E6O75_ATG10448 [Venturia nashicola]TLD27490.1 uncharacterized protein E2P81_ATG10778 [Venturia nashicola]
MSSFNILQAWSQRGQLYQGYSGKSRLSYDSSGSGVTDTDTDTDELFDPSRFSSKKARAQPSRRCYQLAFISLLAALALVLYAITTKLSIHNYTDSLSTDQTYNILRSPCGNSTAEARALGCHFDIITFSWLPDRCYDAELSKNFEDVEEWDYFLDHNKTQRVEKAEALTGEYDGLYVSWKYHIIHCVYMWEKMHRAVLGLGKPAIDGYIGPLAHTRHCGEMLTMRLKFSDYNTRIKVKYPDCGID